MGQQVRRDDKSSGEAHVLRFLLVMLALAVEGFDLQAANFAGPSIAAGFHIARSTLGPLLSASLVGILVGSTQIAPLGDRFGRKRILVLASVAFGVLSLISALAGSPTQLIVLRFLIGIGLGGVMPNGLALAGEQFSHQRQASMIGLVGIGISLGAVAAGVTAARVLPLYGWRGLFVVGGILPVLIAIVIALAMPESATSHETRTSASVEAISRPGSVKAILEPAMRSMTVMIWLVFIGTTLTFYLLAGWIPLLLKGSGWSIAGAAWITAGFHMGGVIGGVCASLALTRGGWSIAAIFIGGAALTMIALAFAKPGAVETVTFIIAAGFCTTGTLNAINGATGGAYPPQLRSTGLGWALGTGRVGSILGPLVGSVAALVNLDQNNRFFVIPVIPLVLVMILAIQLARHTSLVPVLRG